MPPKTGLLGTLSAIALGAGMAAASVSDAQAQARFVEVCSWIDNTTSIARLQQIMTKLQANADECYFDPVTGASYCKACIDQAAAKIVQLTATAAGGTGGGGGGGAAHGP